MYVIEESLKIKVGGNGIVYTDCIANNSVEFMAELPANAVVDYVEVEGKSLDEIGINADVKYPRDFKFDGHSVAAVVRYPEGTSNEKLYQHASVHNIKDFVVHYHRVAIAEG